MFDWFWRTLGYTLKKDLRKEYTDRKIKEEEDIVTFERIAKQKSQQRTYARATLEGPIPQSPPLPIRKSKRIISKK